MAALLTDAAIAQKSLEEEINAIFSSSIGDDRGRRSPQNEIGKLVGGAFGLVTQEQANAIIDAVNAGATATNHIIDHLGSDETRLAATTNDVRFLNRSIHYLAHTLQNGQSETRMVAQAIHIAGYQARTRSKVHRAQAALHGLDEGRVTSHLVSRNTARRLLSKLTRRAALHAGRVALRDPEDIYDCPASMSRTAWSWRELISRNRATSARMRRSSMVISDCTACSR